MKDSILEHVPAGLMALFAAMSAWFARYVLGFGKRLSALEADRVTRTDIDEVTASLTAQISNNQIRTEEKLERIWTHLAGGGR